jgi:tRNA dimethylallyltransferase
MFSNKKWMIIIAGPTAVGKTAIATGVAAALDTEIISADSRQCYHEMNIGVARPSQSELDMVPHHFLASHSIHDEVNARIFADYALEKAMQIFKEKDHVIVTGGTGLYIKALTEGMDEIPEVHQDVRSAIIKAYEEGGLEWLQERIRQADPVFYAEGEIQNPQRLMRALEVYESTGRSITSFQKGIKEKRPFEILKIALDLPREMLYERINARVDQMMENGLLDEVRSLFELRHLNALQTVGYRELFSFLQEETSLEQAVDHIKRNTRHYAKRQVTWFKKDTSFIWLPPDLPVVLQEIEKIIGSEFKSNSGK